MIQRETERDREDQKETWTWRERKNYWIAEYSIEFHFINGRLFLHTIYLHLMLPTIKESVAAFKPH